MKCSAEGHTSPVKDVVWISSDACKVFPQFQRVVSYTLDVVICSASSDSGRVLFASASQDQKVHIWSLAESTAEPQVRPSYMTT